jgi:[ribosomal protein S5]-alanine N-acetyltransferase
MTTRLRLRDFEVGDYQAAHGFATDLAVVRYVEWGPNTPEETQAFLREARASGDVSPRRRYALAVVVQSDPEKLIGSIELRVVSFEHRRGELGYVLARDSWGLGYATEATRRLLAFGFKELGLHKISATCDPRESRVSGGPEEERHAPGGSSSRPRLCPGRVARQTPAQRHPLIGDEGIARRSACRSRGECRGYWPEERGPTAYKRCRQ